MILESVLNGDRRSRCLIQYFASPSTIQDNTQATTNKFSFVACELAPRLCVDLGAKRGQCQNISQEKNKCFSRFASDDVPQRCYYKYNNNLHTYVSFDQTSMITANFQSYKSETYKHLKNLIINHTLYIHLSLIFKFLKCLSFCVFGLLSWNLAVLVILAYEGESLANLLHASVWSCFRTRHACDGFGNMIKHLHTVN